MLPLSCQGKRALKAPSHLVIPSVLEYSGICRIIPHVPVRVGMRQYSVLTHVFEPRNLVHLIEFFWISQQICIFYLNYWLPFNKLLVFYHLLSQNPCIVSAMVWAPNVCDNTRGIIPTYAGTFQITWNHQMWLRLNAPPPPLTLVRNIVRGLYDDFEILGLSLLWENTL